METPLEPSQDRPFKLSVTDFSRRSAAPKAQEPGQAQRIRSADISGVSDDNSCDSSLSDVGRTPDISRSLTETPYGSTSIVRDSDIQIPQFSLGSVRAQVTIEEEEDIEHQPTDSEATAYTPHVSSTPPTFLRMPAFDLEGVPYDDHLLKQGYKRIHSNGNAALVAPSLAAHRSVVTHNKSTHLDVHCESTNSGLPVGQPWDESGALIGEYVKNKGVLQGHAMSYEDQPDFRTQTMLQADADARKLHAARCVHNTAPVDFKSILNEGECVMMQIKCKGLHGLPSTGADIVGDCWLILTRMAVGEQDFRRIYFYQSAHDGKAFSIDEVNQDHRCVCCVAHDSNVTMTATRTQTAYLDMITVEDQLVHAHYEQIKRTWVEKRSKGHGCYARPKCVRDCLSNCPSCSLDLCKAAEKDHCTLAVCCCISCVVPSVCRPGYAKLKISSEPDASLQQVITHICKVTTEQTEESIGPGDVPMALNRMETTHVHEADLCAISIQFAFPNRGLLKESLAIVCPSEPVSKSLKFVMLVSQKPTLLDCPAGSHHEFRRVHSKGSAQLRREARCTHSYV
mmetsp:Transcript_39383/g.63487  ORF Transcript_39383/g.63487 Transcript_39383/m.63487 type:complete len:567 (-) Transcript_39383:6-1706(-)